MFDRFGDFREVTGLLNCAASFLATLLGALLLLADSTNDCERYEPFRASLDFTSNCPLTPSQGHVLLDFPWQGQNGKSLDQSLAEQQLTSAGFGVSTIDLEITGQCSGGEGYGRVSSIAFWLWSPGTAPYKCDRFPLPVKEARSVTCNRIGDASADSRQGDAGVTEMPSCSITFQPPAK